MALRLRGFYGLKNKRLTGIDPRTRRYYHTKRELIEIARNLGIRNYSKYDQKGLADYIENSAVYRKTAHSKEVGLRPRQIEQLQQLRSEDTFDTDDEYETIGERIKKRAVGLEDADWYANELFNELAELGEQRFPKLGELCFFSYTAAYPEEYPYYDQRPLAYILEYRGDKILGANLHYLNPSYRDAVAGSAINKYGQSMPKKTIHSYFFSNMGDIYVLPPSSAEYASVAELVTEKFVDKYGKKVELQMVWDSI